MNIVDNKESQNRDSVTNGDAIRTECSALG